MLDKRYKADILMLGDIHMKKFSFILLMLMISINAYSQVDINSIKNQAYLKNSGKVDCNSEQMDNLTVRICSNLKFQKSDSLMKDIFNKLLKNVANDSLNKAIKTSQDTWDRYRVEHCTVLYTSYSDCGGCHQQAIEYLNCLTELTDERTRTLIELIKKLK